LASCASYDAWEWAQTVDASHTTRWAALDPDGDGTACPELPRGGFANAWWTETIPAEAQAAELIRIIDGDTLEVLINGVSNRVRIYRADTPETQNEQHCGGPEATDYATWALSLNDTLGTISIEKDTTSKDKYGRELAYVWFTVGGQPYMLNHILITNGWAEDVDYGDRTYNAKLQAAAAFAQRHTLGGVGAVRWVRHPGRAGAAGRHDGAAAGDSAAGPAGTGLPGTRRPRNSTAGTGL
jgi:endonuclease YncB( thermonuclease family)